MSNELKHKLYSTTDCIPEQTMYDYIDNKLSPREQHLVEKHMLDCELCADAAEGLRITRNRNRIAEINRAITERIASPDKKAAVINFRMVLSIAAAGALLVGGVFFFRQFTSFEKKDLAELKTTSVKDAKPDSVTGNSSASSSASSPVITKESAAEESIQEDFSVKKEKPKSVNAEHLVTQHDQGLSEKGIAGAGNGATVSDELNTMEVNQPAAPDTDLKKPANSVAGNNNNSVQWTTTAAPAAADKNIYKDDKKDETKEIDRNDDLAKTENQGKEIASAKQQTVSKTATNRAEKTENKKKEYSKEAEEKPSISANTGYTSDMEQNNEQAIALDSTGQIAGKTEQTYSVVDEMPQFPGGTTEMLKYINTNLKYPETDKTSNFAGKIYIRFIVDKEGNIREPKIFKGSGCCPELDKEALKVVSNMPRWKPGRLKGKAVNVLYTLPVEIELR